MFFQIKNAELMTGFYLAGAPGKSYNTAALMRTTRAGERPGS
jgi:hypothetical protein